jgi:hypothetical protein
MYPFADNTSLSSFADTRDDTHRPELIALLGLLLTRKDAVRLPHAGLCPACSMPVAIKAGRAFVIVAHREVWHQSIFP